MSDKIYCGNGRIVSGKFGDIIKISMHRNDLKRIAEYMNENETDWINLELKRKKSPVDGKPTHSLQIDTWKPNVTKAEPVNPSAEPSNDLPF